MITAEEARRLSGEKLNFDLYECLIENGYRVVFKEENCV